MCSANLCFNRIVKFQDIAVLKSSFKHAPGEVMVLIQIFLFHRFVSQLLLKLGF